MTKAELIQKMADHAGMDKKQAQKALEAFTSCVTEAMKSGEDVRLVGFGTFKGVDRKAGKARNPRTGETVDRPASKTCKFQVGEALKGALNA